MTTKFILATLSLTVLLPSSCPLFAQGQSSDEIFAERLVGTWEGAEIEKTYHADGTASGFIWLRENPEGTRVSFKSEWHVENGYLTSTVRESSDPQALPIDSSFRDQIVSVSADDFIFVNDLGEREVRKRKKPTPTD